MLEEFRKASRLVTWRKAFMLLTSQKNPFYHFQMVNNGYDQCKFRPLFLYYCLTKSLSIENFLFARWLLKSQLSVTIDGTTSLNGCWSLRFPTEFRAEIHQEPRDEIESFSPAERPVGFKSWNIWFYCNTLTHWATFPWVSLTTAILMLFQLK